MKPFILFLFHISSTNGQNYDSPRDVGEQTMDLCFNWINSSLVLFRKLIFSPLKNDKNITCKSMSCQSQKWRSSKYVHRFQKLIGDALWHVESTKKCGINRKRGKRDSELDISGEYDDFVNYADSMIAGEYDDFESLQYNYEEFVNETEKVEAINNENELGDLARARGNRRPKKTEKSKKDERQLVCQNLMMILFYLSYLLVLGIFRQALQRNLNQYLPKKNFLEAPH